ncbi:MAG: outer membrane protein assembly factor BamE [Pseudomonadota bacterium]
MAIPFKSYVNRAGRYHPGEMFSRGKRYVLLAIGTTLLSGCAGFGSPALVLGEPESAVVAKLGRPTHVIEDGDARILEYMTGPFGQTTHLAKITSDGRLASYEQVLTTQKFAQIVIGGSTKPDVLRLIGTPSQTSYLDLPKLEVWSYPYWENPVSDSIMHVHFDRAGIVQKLLNGPDLRRDSDHGAINLNQNMRGSLL